MGAFLEEEADMNTLEQIMEKAGVHEFGIVPTADIRFMSEVRAMCEVNTCRSYGKYWTCPPGVGTVEECRDRCRAFDTMLVFTGKYDLEDSFDFEGMTAGMAAFKDIARVIDAEMKELGGEYLLLSNEGCDFCGGSCTYPDAPCRHPDRAKGSLEGYGIMVSELAKQAGIKYINGPNTVTYFGALMI